MPDWLFGSANDMPAWVLVVGIAVNAAIAFVAVRSVLPKSPHVIASIEKWDVESSLSSWFLAIRNLGPGEIVEVWFPNETGNQEFFDWCVRYFSPKDDLTTIFRQFRLPVLENGQIFRIGLGVRGRQHVASVSEYIEPVLLTIRYKERINRVRTKRVMVPVIPVER